MSCCCTSASAKGGRETLETGRGKLHLEGPQRRRRAASSLCAHRCTVSPVSSGSAWASWPEKPVKAARRLIALGASPTPVLLAWLPLPATNVPPELLDSSLDCTVSCCRWCWAGGRVDQEGWGGQSLLLRPTRTRAALLPPSSNPRLRLLAHSARAASSHATPRHAPPARPSAPPAAPTMLQIARPCAPLPPSLPPSREAKPDPSAQCDRQRAQLSGTTYSAQTSTTTQPPDRTGRCRASACRLRWRRRLTSASRA
jgi:hypothetical protein